MSTDSIPFQVFISTFPFGSVARRPLEMLDGAGIPYKMNPYDRKLTEDELASLLESAEVLIAGTEPITEKVMNGAPKLGLIARVGIGLDSVDLIAARQRGLAVTYTPDGPAPAVAELTVGLMIDLLRQISAVAGGMREQRWDRVMGRRLECLTVGIVGMGRIGGRVARVLRGGFPGVRILASDIRADLLAGDEHPVEWVDKDTLYRESDIITLHVPLTFETRGLVGPEQIALMKPTALLINTARGGIVDEAALAESLLRERLGGAALDVFDEEPYRGPLVKVERCLLTCHMGSMTEDCRADMELGATEEALRFFRGEPYREPVPEVEYELAMSAGRER